MYTYYRFQSETEQAIEVFELPLDGDLMQVMTKLEIAARPIVGLRSKATEEWWSYPIAVVYLSIDTTIDGKNGIKETI